jgi:nucleoporin GLE1
MDGGSPSRQSPSRKSSHKPRNSIVRDPYDSPGRQLAIEFNLRLSISDRDFNERLDQAAAERARLHTEQLARAAEEHRKVIRSAELEVQRITLEEEQAKARALEAQQREVERLQQEKAQQQAEAHRRALEAKQREEEATRQAAERQRQLQETEARLKAQREQEAAAERQKKEKEEADRKAKEAQEAAEKARQQQASQAQVQQSTQIAAPTAAPASVVATATSSNTQATATNVDQLHAKYLELHARMKQFRIQFAEEAKKKDNPLKPLVGDTRRNIRLRLGQINTDRKDSVAAIKRLREDSFNIALSTRGPTIDIRPFIISHPIPQLADEREAQYPAFLLYMWICFEKFVLKQFEKEAAAPDGRTIQEIGLIAASLLADQRYMWQGLPLTDIVLAKLHRVCPILFGVRGTMNTAEGRIRLGWLPKSAGSEEQYGQRMRGLGAGYAALSLRSFNAKAPAVPMSDYWRAIVSICNTPTDSLWPGHFALIHGLTKDYYKKFLTFYGAQARGVLRRATIDLPARAPPRCKDAAGTVSVLPVGWAQNDGINLS